MEDIGMVEETGPGLNMAIIDVSTFHDDQLTPRGLRQQRRWTARDGFQGLSADDYMDDDYEDQESVFGDNESEFTLRRMAEKFESGHRHHSVEVVHDEFRLHRLSQSLDLDIPRTSALAIHVEQFEDFPSAASFPTEEIAVHGYNYHIARKRMLSLSSPALCNERGSQPAMDSWYKATVS